LWAVAVGLRQIALSRIHSNIANHPFKDAQGLFAEEMKCGYAGVENVTASLARS